MNSMRKGVSISVALALVITACAATALGCTTTTKKNGEAIWSALAATKTADVNIHVTVPEKCIATVTGFDASGHETAHVTETSNVDTTFDDVHSVTLTYSDASIASLECQWSIVGAPERNGTTFDAVKQDVALIDQKVAATYNLHVGITTDDTATVRAKDGDDVVHEWTVTKDKPLDVTVRCRRIEVARGGGEGTFRYSVGP